MNLQPLPDFDEDLHQFLNLARQYPALDPGEEETLLARYREGDHQAVVHLVNANLRYLVELAVINEDRWRHVQMLDLFAAGVTALEEAIRTYQTARQGPLRPYVIKSIERALDALAHSVRIRHASASQIPAPRSQTKARDFRADARVPR
jgi:DNA-directed RNA polymerase sigma subunit (sigma70/sigma32)